MRRALQVNPGVVQACNGRAVGRNEPSQMVVWPPDLASCTGHRVRVGRGVSRIASAGPLAHSEPGRSQRLGDSSASRRLRSTGISHAARGPLPSGGVYQELASPIKSKLSLVVVGSLCNFLGRPRVGGHCLPENVGVVVGLMTAIANITGLHNNGLQLTRAARCAPSPFAGGQSLRAALAAEAGCWADHHVADIPVEPYCQTAARAGAR